MANPNPNRKGLAPQWQKGQSGNPSGRPKKRPITDEYFWLADQEIPEKMRKQLETKFGLILPKGATFAKMTAIRRFMEAMGLKPEQGGTRAAKEIADRMEGKPPQRLEISGPEKKEISILVKFDRKKK